jgi:enoyl-CoA hydratase/carnithine racemase
VASGHGCALRLEDLTMPTTPLSGPDIGPLTGTDTGAHTGLDSGGLAVGPTPAPDVGAEAVLLSERRGAVLVLTLNRPAARNALSEALIAALVTAISAAGQDPVIRAIVLAANGTVFCAGHDLKELTARRSDPDQGAAFFRTIMSACAAMMQAIVACPKPVIAAVQGVASAAGCQLVATCDLAVASETATFATPGVSIGLFCSSPMVALSRAVSRKHAMEMLLLGEMVDAHRAVEFGLINRVVPGRDARAEALRMADTIAAKSPVSVAIGKVAFYHQIEQALPEAYAYAAEVMVKNMLTGDAVEGIGAFIDKRKPEWPGT